MPAAKRRRNDKDEQTVRRGMPKPRSTRVGSGLVTPIKTLVAAALLAPPPALYRMHLDVAALCEIDWYADGPAVLRSFNDTAHLSH